jgi:antagonist of KipI
MSSILIIKPGMLTTVQDLGRWGHQAEGVPVGGPMDPYAHRLANLLVGNPDGAATLEITLLGPEIVFERESVVALAGADLSPTIDGRAAPMHTSFHVSRDSRLRFGARREGVRAYLAVGGGIQTTRVLGSRATHVLTAMGGLDGRPLRAGDRLEIGTPAETASPGRRQPPVVPLPAEGGAVLRVMRGPDEAYFGEEAFEALESDRFAILPESGRMAYRLDGPSVRTRTPDLGRKRTDVGQQTSDAGRVIREFISDATPLGTIQVPPSGQPMLLMADRQTCGGYPRMATLITADLALAGQLAPGDWIRFRVCTHAEAFRALIAQERIFAGR